jgi:hypothetical protein
MMMRLPTARRVMSSPSPVCSIRALGNRTPREFPIRTSLAFKHFGSGASAPGPRIFEGNFLFVLTL